MVIKPITASLPIADAGGQVKDFIDGRTFMAKAPLGRGPLTYEKNGNKDLQEIRIDELHGFRF